MIKCVLILGVFKGKVRAKVLYLHHQPNHFIHNQNQHPKTYPQVYPQPVYNHHVHALLCLALLLACCACGVYHIATTHYTRHKTSNITKDYIYIDIIYHMIIKSRLIKRESLTGQYHATSHKIRP